MVVNDHFHVIGLSFLYFVSCDLNFKSFITLQIMKNLKIQNIVFNINDFKGASFSCHLATHFAIIPNEAFNLRVMPLGFVEDHIVSPPTLSKG